MDNSIRIRMTLGLAIAGLVVLGACGGARAPASIATGKAAEHPAPVAVTDAVAAAETEAPLDLGTDLAVATWKAQKLVGNTNRGFDTWEIRFKADGPRIGSAVESELHSTGTIASAAFTLLRGDGLIILSIREAGAASTTAFATILSKDGGYEVTSAVLRSFYRRAASGALVITRSLYGEEWKEEYGPDGKGKITGVKDRARQGFFRKSNYGIAEYAEIVPGDSLGNLDRAFVYTRKGGDYLAFSVEEVEPIAEVRMRGLQNLCTGPDALQNLILADLIFGLDRRMTPVLAWALLGVEPAARR